MEQLKGKMEEKGRTILAFRSVKDVKIIVVQRLSAKVPGKAQKHSRVEAHEFLSFEDLEKLWVTLLYNSYPSVTALLLKFCSNKYTSFKDLPFHDHIRFECLARLSV